MARREIGHILEHPCPDCGAEMVLRDSVYGLFYGCTMYPTCDATHGAHETGEPLGIPAGADTKRLRMAAHAVVDVLWNCKPPLMNRRGMYRWMRDAMSMSPREAHIGRFDAAQCEQLIAKAVERLKEGVTA